MPSITLSIDGYGKYARRSMVADYLEIYAWSRGASIGDLADLLGDRGLRLPDERFVDLDDEPLSVIDDEAADAFAESSLLHKGSERALEDAGKVYKLLQERESILGDLYPYHVADNYLVRRDKTITPYDVLLTLSLRHACLKAKGAAHEFEEYVEACLRAAQWSVFPLGIHVRRGRVGGAAGFRAALDQARQALGLAARGTGKIPKAVHDRRADLLARVRPTDPRPGCGTHIFQATVGRSESWNVKLHETPRLDWRDYFGDETMPSVALVIPHHAEIEHLRELVRNGESRVVWDRLRLVAHRPVLTARVLMKARAVLEQGAEW